MSKYDFDVDLSQNSSTGLILSKIQPGSVVLEFGCAAGRMTRYMKEALNCKVFVVEMDSDAYKKASIYAEDGLCDDIMNFEWVSKFKNIFFDAVIFADVLEHLRDPETVLAKASKLLNANGSIFVSVPNITHNDVLLKQYYDRFDYTNIGILDDTHIHFWGLKNIVELSGRCGLFVKSVEGTHCAMGDTEQCASMELQSSTLLTNLLRQRKCGDVYQFIFTLVKTDVNIVQYSFKTPFVFCCIYFDRGDGYNANDIVMFQAEHSGSGVYVGAIHLENLQMVKKVRLDPVENQGCIIRQVEFKCADSTINAQYTDAVPMTDGFLVTGKDPSVWAELPTCTESLDVSVTFLIANDGYVDCLQNEVVEQSRRSAIMQADMKSLSKQIDSLQDQNCLQIKEIKKLQTENDALKTDIGAYIRLISQKEKLAVQQQAVLEEQIRFYQKLRVVRLRNSAARVWRWVKRKISGITRRGNTHE